MAIKVGINGFGRIGRMFLRAALTKKDIEVVAVNDITDAPTLAHLLKYDSIHGTLRHEVKAEGGSIFLDGKPLQVLAERDPAKLPWSKLGVQVVSRVDGTVHRARQSRVASGGRREESRHQRPRRRRRRHVMPRRQPSCVRPEEARRDFQRVVHHQLPRSDRQSPAREFRRGSRPDDHRAQLHVGSDAAGWAAQGFATRARRCGLDDSDLDWRCEGYWPRAARAQRQARRNRDSSADVERLAGRSDRDGREGRRSEIPSTLR